MERLYSPREASKLLGVCVKTVQDWDRAGKIRCVRTPNGRRRVPESEISRVQGEREIRRPAIYARVSSRDQAVDLESQISMLRQRYPAAVVYSDVSSGLKFDRQGFLNLLKAVQEKRVSKVMVTLSLSATPHLNTVVRPPYIGPKEPLDTQRKSQLICKDIHF